jgi:hypothetical protein
MTKKRSKFNIIDVLILLVIIIIIAAGIWFFANFARNDGIYVYFTIELRNRESGFADLILPDDEIRDSVRNYFLGHVVWVDEQPALMVSFDHRTQTYIETIIPDRYDVFVTIRGVGNQSEAYVRTHGHDMRIGQSMFIRGRGYAGVGYIVGLEIHDRQNHERGAQ